MHGEVDMAAHGLALHNKWVSEVFTTRNYGLNYEDYISCKKDFILQRHNYLTGFFRFLNIKYQISGKIFMLAKGFM